MAEAMTAGTAVIALVLLWWFYGRPRGGRPLADLRRRVGRRPGIGIHTVSALSGPAILIYLGLAAIRLGKKLAAVCENLAAGPAWAALAGRGADPGQLSSR